MFGRIRKSCAYLLLALTCANASAQGVKATGSLVAARAGHTATALDNGRVLVTGGLASGQVLSSAELYDPATGVFTGTGGMFVLRTGHTATRMPDGKVLVTGGFTLGNTGFGGGASVPTPTADLYDPVRGAFTRFAPMTRARANHTATLLADGSVIIAGGDGFTGSMPYAERYDPLQDRWQSIASMTVSRSAHTATALADGSVLVVGGTGLTVVDHYSTQANLWISEPVPFVIGTASTVSVLTSGLVVFGGGINGSTALGAVITYNPGNARYLYSDGLAVARSALAAVVINGTGVAFIGGLTQSSTASADIDVFDGSASAITLRAHLLAARSSHTATRLADGRILVVGGIDAANNAMISAELIDPARLPEILADGFE